MADLAGYAWSPASEQLADSELSSPETESEHRRYTVHVTLHVYLDNFLITDPFLTFLLTY